MSVKSWKLYCQAERPVSGDLQHDDLPAVAVNARRLSGGLSDGVDLLCVTNGDLEINILPTRGMGIWDMKYHGRRIGWLSPVAGPVHPALVNLAEPSGLGWLDGFDELLVRCGLESNGAPDFNEQGQLEYPLHGRIANRPARQVEIAIDSDTQQVTITGVVEETRFHFTKLRLTSTLTTRLGDKGFTLVDRVENLSQTRSTCQLLYHINVGQPVLEAGSRIVAPVRQLVPRDDASATATDRWDVVDPPAAGAGEHAFYMELHANDRSQSQIVLHNAAATQGVSLEYDTAQLPYFTLWKNGTAEADGYVVGLEPATNFPNPHRFERARQRYVSLEPRSFKEFSLQFNYLDSADDVTAACQSIEAIQGQRPSTVSQTPVPSWCPSAC